MGSQVPLKVLFDTNVVLDLLLDRKPFSTAAARLLSEAEAGRLTGCVCATTITTIHYLASKVLGAKKAREDIGRLLSFLEVAAVNRPVIESALGGKMADFEDSVLAEAAKQVGANALVTRNARDFKKAGIPVHSPEELLVFLKLSGPLH